MIKKVDKTRDRTDERDAKLAWKQKKEQALLDRKAMRRMKNVFRSHNQDALLELFDVETDEDENW